MVLNLINKLLLRRHLISKLVIAFAVAIFISNLFPINNANAAFLSNGFIVTSKFLDFSVDTRLGKCSSRIFYPEISGDDEVLPQKINATILEFAKRYKICSVKEKYEVSYDLQEGSEDYFSVKWTATTDEMKKKKFIYSLNFDRETGELLNVEDIISPLSRNFMPEIVKLSQHHLAADINWEQFLDKVDNMAIQFYILNSVWYIVFNPTMSSNKEVVQTPLPKYLQKE